MPKRSKAANPTPANHAQRVSLRELRECADFFVVAPEGQLRIEEQLRRQNQLLSTMNDISLGLIRRLPPEELLAYLLGHAMNLAGASIGATGVFDSATGRLRVEHSKGPDALLSGDFFNVHEGLMHLVWETGALQIIEDYRNWSGRLPDKKFDMMTSVVLMPLKFDGRIAGVIGLIFVDRIKTFPVEERDLLQRFNEIASIAFDNSRLYTALQDELWERRRIEACISEKRSQLYAILDNIPYMAWLKDEEGRFLAVNSVFAAFCGKPVDQIVNLTDMEIWPAEMARKYQEEDKAVMESGCQRLIQEVVAGVTGEIWVETLKTPVFDCAGKLLGTTGLARDITEQRRIAEQLRQTEKMESVSSLARGIAHDFNGLLTVILGNAELALNLLPVDIPAHKNIERVIQAGKKSRNLLQQILALGTRQAPIRKKIKLGRILDEVVQVMDTTFPANIKVQRHNNARSDILLGDPGQLNQVVMNLVSNAVQAMHNSGGILTLSLRNESDEEHFHTPDWLVLEVGDTGTGMSRSEQDRMFEPFFTTKPAGQGSGLGLSVVYGIVQRHAGKIHVASEEGKGTVITVLLPQEEK